MALGIVKVYLGSLISANRHCLRSVGRGQLLWTPCDECQKTVDKGTVARTPLGEMPLIDTQFKQFAMDIVGLITPASERGHRYILTLVD